MRARLNRQRLERTPLGCNAVAMVAGRSRSFWCASGAGMVLSVWLACALGGCTGPGLEPPFGSRNSTSDQGGQTPVTTGTGGTASTGGTLVVGSSGGSGSAGGNTASGGSLSSTGGMTSAGTGGTTSGPPADASTINDQDGSMKDAGVGDAATSDAATGQQ